MTVEDEVPRDPADWTEEDMLSLAMREIVTVDGLLSESEAAMVRWGGNAIEAISGGRKIRRLKEDGTISYPHPCDIYISIPLVLVTRLAREGRAGIHGVVKRLRILMEKGVHVELIDVP